MPFPTTGILDDFNRADQGPFPSSSWDGSVFGESATSQLRVVSNQAGTSLALDAKAYWKQVFSANQEGFFTVAVMIEDGGDFWIMLRSRQMGTSGGTTTTTDGYFYSISRAVSTYSLKFYRVDNTVFTQVGSTQTPGSWTAGDKFGARIVGSELQAYQCPVSTGVWGTYGTSVTDTTYTHDGQIAIGEGVNGTCRLDDFGGGAVQFCTFNALPNGSARWIRPRPFAPGLAR